MQAEKQGLKLHDYHITVELPNVEHVTKNFNQDEVKNDEGKVIKKKENFDVYKIPTHYSKFKKEIKNYSEKQGKLAKEYDADQKQKIQFTEEAKKEAIPDIQGLSSQEALESVQNGSVSVLKRLSNGISAVKKSLQNKAQKQQAQFDKYMARSKLKPTHNGHVDKF